MIGKCTVSHGKASKWDGEDGIKCVRTIGGRRRIQESENSSRVQLSLENSI